MKNYFFHALIMLCFLINGCDKPIPTNELFQKKPSSQYFPMAIGNSWTYNVFDSSHQVISSPSITNYDVTVTITGTTKMGNNTDVLILKYQYPQWSDTLYLQVVNDSVKFLNTKEFDYYGPSSNTFIVPFSDNQSYTSVINNSPYNYHVQNLLSYNSAFLHADSLYQINRTGGRIGFNQDQYYIFKSTIGFVEFTNSFMGVDTFDKQTWRLKSYNLK